MGKRKLVLKWRKERHYPEWCCTLKVGADTYDLSANRLNKWVNITRYSMLSVWVVFDATGTTTEFLLAAEATVRQHFAEQRDHYAAALEAMGNGD